MSDETLTLDPAKTALVLIEYQNEFTTDGGVLHGAVAEVMDRPACSTTPKRSSRRPGRPA